MAENDAFSEDPTFGEELRKQREIRGISLKEIADSTKISKRFLEALEKNDLRTLPAPVFTRGFVREYARYLGLNADEMVSRYAQILRRAEEAEQQSAPSAKAPIAPPRSLQVEPKPAEAPARTGAGLWIALVAAVALAIVFGAMLLMRRAPSKPSEPAPAAAVPATAAPAPAPATAAAAAVPTEELEMRLRLREDSWLTVEVDGERQINDVLTQGTERVLHAKESIVFKTIGNAGALELTLNGKPMPPLGQSGDVMRDLRYDRRSLEEGNQP